MKFPKSILLFFVIILSFTVVSAQVDEIIKVDSSVVRLNIGVVDEKGRPITKLGKENFAVYEDGVKQQIAQFEPTIAPFSVVMLLDMSGSTLGFRETIKQSASRFVDALAPDDRVSVVEFYDKVNLRNDFTTDRRIILNSINVANGRGKTQLYKAIDFALVKLAKEGKRRKAIIVLTDGVDSSLQNDDRNSLEKVNQSEISTALKPADSSALVEVLNKTDAQGITIYPLALPTGDPTKLADPTPTQVAMFSAARSRLEILAKRSGGTLNTINRLEEMGKLYAAVAADLRTLYTVEYQSSNDKRDGKWREIRVDVNNPELISRTRQGYYAK